MKKPTLIDVAGAAGVSRATASRVLSGSNAVDMAMTEAVRQAARDLGYRPNASARMLRGGKSGSIALVMATNEIDLLSASFITGPLRGATSHLIQANLQPVLLLADPARLESLAEYLADGHVDGAIIILQHEISHISTALRDLGLPLVFVGRPLGTGVEHLLYVECDNYGGGRLAARTLIAAGRTDLAVISGPSDVAASDQRLAGWLDELDAHGLGTRAVARGDFTMQGGAAAMARLMAHSDHLDGLFASSDLMAVGAIRVLQAGRLAVPHDISLIGFDDSVVATTSDPPLSSIRQPLLEMGRAAAELVVAVLDGAPASPIVLPTTLTVRESV